MGNWVNDPKNKNKVTTTGTNYALFGAYDPTKSVGVKASEIQPVTYAGNAIGSGGTIPTAVPNSYTPTSGTVSTSNPVKYSGNVGDIQVEEHVSTGTPVLYSQGVEKSWDELTDDEKVIRAKSKADGGDYSEMTMLLGELKQKELADASAAAQKAIADHTASYNLSKPTYGASGYNLATKGLAGSGYADYLANQNYSTYRGNVQSALDTQAKTEAEIKSKYIDKLYNLSTEQKQAADDQVNKYINLDEGTIKYDELVNDWDTFGDTTKKEMLQKYKDYYQPTDLEGEAFVNDLDSGAWLKYKQATSDLNQLKEFANKTGDPDVLAAYNNMKQAYDIRYDVVRFDDENFQFSDFNGKEVAFYATNDRTGNKRKFSGYNVYKIDPNTTKPDEALAYDVIINKADNNDIVAYNGHLYYKRGADVYLVDDKITKYIDFIGKTTAKNLFAHPDAKIGSRNKDKTDTTSGGSAGTTQGDVTWAQAAGIAAGKGADPPLGESQFKNNPPTGYENKTYQDYLNDFVANL